MTPSLCTGHKQSRAYTIITTNTMTVTEEACMPDGDPFTSVVPATDINSGSSPPNPTSSHSKNADEAALHRTAAPARPGHLTASNPARIMATSS